MNSKAKDLLAQVRMLDKQISFLLMAAKKLQRERKVESILNPKDHV